MKSLNAYIIIIAIALISAAIGAYIKFRKLKKKISTYHSKLDRITFVNLSEAEIKSATSLPNEEEGLSSTTALDVLHAERLGRTTRQNIEVCQIIAIGLLPKGQRQKFISQTIEISPITLRYKLDQKKTTQVFYSNENPKECLFDLSFLTNDR